MSLFMERGVNQAERELWVFGLPNLTKAPLVAIVEAHQGDRDRQHGEHGEHGHEQQVPKVHRDTKDRQVAVREGAIRGLSLIIPLVTSGS